MTDISGATGAELIAAFRAQLDARERLANHMIRNPYYVNVSEADREFLAQTAFTELRAIVVQRDLLDLLADTYRQQANEWAWIDRSPGSEPVPPHSPWLTVLPGLEAAVRVLAAQYDDPAPAVREWLEKVADHWQTGTAPAPVSNIRAIVETSWLGYDMSVDMSLKDGATRSVGGSKVRFHARLIDGTEVSIPERSTP